MKPLKRIKNQTISKLISHSAFLKQRFIQGIKTAEIQGIPWASITKPLSECKIAIVTTAGVHHKGQSPFDMMDENGDPSFRIIDARCSVNSLMITHDYYDHSDADKDINIVFPIERMKELEAEKIIGKTAQIHYGFMGHIKGPHVRTLIDQTAPKVAEKLIEDSVDVVLLTPG